MKSWVIYVRKDGRYTGLHFRCPHSAVSYGVATHALHKLNLEFGPPSVHA